MILFWKQDLVSFTITSEDRQVVTGIVNCQGHPLWQVAAIYASTSSITRRSLWTDPSSFIGSPLPSLLIGDFNSIDGADETMGRFSEDSGVAEFREFITNNGLIDLGFSGALYTWCNMRPGHSRLWERLDRALASDEWRTIFPNASISHLAHISSDHAPFC